MRGVMDIIVTVFAVVTVIAVLMSVRVATWNMKEKKAKAAASPNPMTAFPPREPTLAELCKDRKWVWGAMLAGYERTEEWMAEVDEILNPSKAKPATTAVEAVNNVGVYPVMPLDQYVKHMEKLTGQVERIVDCTDHAQRAASAKDIVQHIEWMLQRYTHKPEELSALIGFHRQMTDIAAKEALAAKMAKVWTPPKNASPFEYADDRRKRINSVTKERRRAWAEPDKGYM